MSPTRPWTTLRSILAAVLITAACTLAPLGSLALWVRYDIGDTDTYVATMAPLASDSAVQRDVVAAVTDAIMTYVDQQDDGPYSLSGGSGPPRNSVEAFVHDAVRSFTGTPAFRTAWNATNRVTHAAVVRALRAGQDGEIDFDVAPISAHVRERLAADAMPFAHRIPVEHADVTVLGAHDLTVARKGFCMLQMTGPWLAATSVVLAVGGLLCAVRRRRALAAVGTGLAVGGALLLAAIAVGRDLALGDLPPDVSPGAAGAVYDALTRTLWVASWTVLGTGAALALLTLVGRRRTPGPPRHDLPHGPPPDPADDLPAGTPSGSPAGTPYGPPDRPAPRSGG